MKEKLAEQWILYHFNAGSTMLLEARLSPAFWPDAVAYSNYCFDRIPNINNHGLAPLEVITGERPDWHNIKVFGSEVYTTTPNNALHKIPGLSKGSMKIFCWF